VKEDHVDGLFQLLLERAIVVEGSLLLYKRVSIAKVFVSVNFL
jgi:hypothetical protein